MPPKELLCWAPLWIPHEGFSIIMKAWMESQLQILLPAVQVHSSQSKCNGFRMSYLHVGLRTIPNSVSHSIVLWVTFHRPSLIGARWWISSNCGSSKMRFKELCLAVTAVLWLCVGSELNLLVHRLWKTLASLHLCCPSIEVGLNVILCWHICFVLGKSEVKIALLCISSNPHLLVAVTCLALGPNVILPGWFNFNVNFLLSDSPCGVSDISGESLLKRSVHKTCNLPGPELWLPEFGFPQNLYWGQLT